MSFAQEPTLPGAVTFAAQADADARADFLGKTYIHLAGAIGAFVVLEAILLQIPGIGNVAMTMLSGWNWLIVLGAFMLVSYVAERWAQSAVSMPMQYLGLGVYVAAEAVIFLPLLFLATTFGGPNTIPTAAALTLTIFAGLSVTVFVTRKNFSFLRTWIVLGGFMALGLIAASVLIGFTLGTVFVVAMVGFASACVLYQTSEVMHHYRVGQHVAASLALFAAIALLFWYVLMFVMDRE